ncbi:hypothetical protein ACI6PS_02505 [Flavobacterium sp. PLA-1-15]|uniref:hypothetical protein n=1 Tax=Flavobacterium sp. PLA-1-15 TaxID=3380533 RepID=UPI003B802C3C
MQQAAAMVMTFLGLSEMPIADGKVSLDDAQSTKLKDHLTEATATKLIEAFNKDLAEETTAGEIKASIEALLAETDISAEELDQILADAKKEGKEDTLAVLQAIESKMVAQKAKIQQLLESAEDDTPEEILKKTAMGAKWKHTATHLFGSKKEYDAIDNDRGWNAAAAKGLSVSSVDYTDPVTVNRLNGDATLYFRENPTELKSLHRDNFNLPDFWPKRLNVDDKVASGTILTAEITQGRKFGWLPKNIQEIEAEEGKIYPVQIDAEWNGAQLQEIEASWLNYLNKEGSQPEKMSFVKFLVGELMKRARIEDRISTLNGIFVQTPKGAKKAGRYINRQNGVFYQLWKARDVNKKFRAFEMGEISPTNVYDYFHSDDEANLGVLKRLPQDVVKSPNLVVYLHYKVWDWYKAKYKQLNGTNMDYKGLPDHFENYPNVRVETFVDQENPSFFFATFDDNIEILENIPSEKAAFRFQTLLRMIYMLADYKLGVRIIHIGREVNPNDPEEFKVQSVWSNDQPIFLEDKFIPVFDNTTGKVSVDYKNIQVDEEWATNITEFTNLKAGQTIKVRGNVGMIASKNISSGSKITLTGGAFDLKDGGTITFYVKADFTLLELSRKGLPAGATTSDIDFSSDDINASLGNLFRYTGGASETLDSISGGSEGKVIRIYGTDASGVDFTVANVADQIVVGTSVVLGTSAHYIELVKVDGIWRKTISVTS